MPVSASAGLKPLEEKPPLKLRVAREVKTQRGQPRSTRSLPVAAPQRRVEVEGQRPTSEGHTTKTQVNLVSDRWQHPSD